MTDSPVPGAPDDFDDQTEVVGVPRAAARAADPGPSSQPPDGQWDEEEATAVVSATDVGGFFGDRFRVDARLGIGAMGRVLTAVDMKTGTLVALKVLHKDRQKDPAVVERFQREAAVLREIHHPAIVQLVAFGQAKDGTWWLAMEHLVGKTLKDRLSQGGPFVPRDAWPVLATMCDGVALAHAKGILHRDLKPENVLLLESGLPPCKILDFGLSRYTAKPDRITATGTVLGTPRYMAPEMLHEHAPIDERADVFAIGAIAFEMFTGRSVYPAEDFGQLFGCILEGRTLSLRSVRPDASPELERVLADALARDVDARIRTVDELAMRLARAIGVSEDRAMFLPAASGVRRAVTRAPETPPRGAQDTARDLPRLARGAPRDTTRDLPLVGPIAPPLVAPPPRIEPPPPFVPAPPPPQPSWSTPAQGAAPFAATPPPAPVATQPQAQPPLPQPPPAQPPRAGYGGVAPPASFTRPERAITVTTTTPRRPPWLWIGVFFVAAIVTMVGAGALAYAFRLYLAH